MDGEKITQLFWDRDEAAIAQASEAYGSYLQTVASHILGNSEDVEECLNDTWLQAWNSIPPARPKRLSLYLAKLTRNLAIDAWRRSKALKRTMPAQVLLSELEECIPDPRQPLEAQYLRQVLQDFLRSLPEKKRSLLLCRYWYGDSIEKLAVSFRMSEGAVHMQLKRLREKLRRYLEERGEAL